MPTILIVSLLHNNIIDLCALRRGGIKLFFNGTNLNAVQHPLLEVNDQDYLDIINTDGIWQIDSLLLSLSYHLPIPLIASTSA